MNYVRWLQEVMSQKNLSQSELSRRTGIPQTTISNWLHRGSEPKWSDAVKIAEVLGVTPPPFDLQPVAMHLPGALPLVGEVGAGPPRQVFAGETFDLIKQWKDCIVYRVRGASMLAEGIHDGDYLIVRPADADLATGQVVVAYLKETDGHVVKRWDGKRLYSAAWHYRLGEDDRILGILVGVVRNSK